MAQIFGEDIDSSLESERNTLTVVHPDGATIGFRVAHRSEISRIHDMSVREIGPDVASLEVMQRVHQFDPETMWVVLRAEPGAPGFRIIGCHGYLYLNRTGTDLLERNQFDAHDPDISCLAPPGERPEQMYIWLMVARKLSKIMAPLVIQAFPKPRYGGVPIVARAGTIGGLKSMESSAIFDKPDKGVGDVFKIDVSRTAVGIQLREMEQHR